LEKFVSDHLHLEKSELIQELKRRFQLDTRQAHNQFYNHIKPILARLEPPPVNSIHNDSDEMDLLSFEFPPMELDVDDQQVLPPMELDGDDQQVLHSLVLGEKYVGCMVAKYFVNEDEIFHGIVTSYDIEEGWWMISYADGDFKEMNLDKLECAMNLHSALNNDLSTNNTASRTVAAAPLSDVQSQIALEADNDLSLPVLLHLRESGLSSSVVRYRRNTLCHKSLWSISCLPFPFTETGW
jgi:hypothetical protein